jgi:hypothetical protein
MKKILLVLPILLSMGIAMAAIKPYTLTKIVTGAFDFSMATTEINDIDIDYLEYGRANAMVTKIDLDPTNGGESYQGTIKFAARGIEDGHIFTVTASSKGPLDCNPLMFSNTEINCWALDGKMKVSKYPYGESIDLCYFEITADKAADNGHGELNIYAEDCSLVPNVVLDADVENWDDRLPQEDIVFNYFFRCYGICP